jgi:hypothetical protein
VCGHIHQPQIKKFTNHKGSVTYLNSGDWVENLTALEYDNGKWKIFSYLDELLPDFQEIILSAPAVEKTTVTTFVFVEN